MDEFLAPREDESWEDVQQASISAQHLDHQEAYNRNESRSNLLQQDEQQQSVDCSATQINYDNIDADDSEGSSNSSTESTDFRYYLPMYQATLKGDWESARNFMERDPSAISEPITYYGRTCLHVAAAAGHSQFVKNLVQLMPPEALERRDKYNGDTALHFASIVGITDAARAMVKKNRHLTQITNNRGRTPLLHCATYVAKKRKDMLLFLCTTTSDEGPSRPFSGTLGAEFICIITAAGLYDLALYLVQRYPNLTVEQDQIGRTVLDVLAEKYYDFPSGARLNFWQRWIYSLIPLKVDEESLVQSTRTTMHQNYPRSSRDVATGTRRVLIKVPQWIDWIPVPGIRKVYIAKLAHIQAFKLLKCICSQIALMPNGKILQFFLRSDILSTATKFGTIELLTECISTLSDQLLLASMGKRIFYFAVQYRKVKIFTFMYKMSATNMILDTWRVEQNDNILHIAAKLPPAHVLNKVAGPALQMQRELQWFKAVENIVQPTYKNFENENMDKPRELFTRSHQDLVEKGEKWMRDTTQSCMVVATLIATVVFAGAFTVPGGNYSDGGSSVNGTPIFLHKKSFMVFLVSDALAFFSSTASVLMFLSILTSRFAEEDFLDSLPKRLIIGLATLFFSIVAMLIAFTATLTIVLDNRLAWSTLPISTFAFLPVTLYAFLQFPLLVETFLSTYRPGLLHMYTE